MATIDGGKVELTRIKRTPIRPEWYFYCINRITLKHKELFSRNDILDMAVNRDQTTGTVEHLVNQHGFEYVDIAHEMFIGF